MSEQKEQSGEKQAKTYFQERMEALGTKEEDYAGVFEENHDGDIVIYYFEPDGSPVVYQKSKHGQQKYARLRYHPHRVVKDTKYRTPKGQPGHPFFPPRLSEKFNNKEPIHTLILTEGEFKAFKGCMHGFDCVGLQGIHNLTEKYTDETGQEVKRLAPWITQVIERCQVRNLVFLLDADCRDISLNPKEPNKDLFKRPNNFYTAVRNFKEYVRPLTSCETWFAHMKQGKERPKGLDDLLSLFSVRGAEDLVLEAFNTFKETEFFNFLQLTETNLTKIKSYFNLSNVDVFYNAHQDSLGDKPFVFKRTKYQHNPETDTLEIKKAAEASLYMRVGDTYMKRRMKPQRDGRLVRVYEKVLKSTIKEDYPHIPQILQMVDKYEGFVNQPNNVDYQQIIAGWFNQYNAFQHTPEPGECATSIEMVKHIFGNQVIELPPEQKGEKSQKVPMWKFGLDYIQLLYLRPRIFLPILCLVSEENATGKGTFKDWLRYIFGNNATEVTIKELDSNFNEGYADKLLITLDEAFVDKLQTKETLKRLSTNLIEKVNPKGLSPYDVDFFGKFLVLSNNEKNFIPINKDDDRFWILKVSKPQKDKTNMFEELKAEVPAFLHFLQKRELAIPQMQTRMWFPKEIIYTPAFQKVIKYNRPWLEKAIDDYVKGLFQALLTSNRKEENTYHYDMEEICLDRKMIIQYLNENGYHRFTAHQITDTLKDKFGIQPEKNGTFDYLHIQDYQGQDDSAGQIIMFEKKVNVHYVFTRSQFLTQDEIDGYLAVHQVAQQNKQASNEILPKSNGKQGEVPF